MGNLCPSGPLTPSAAAGAERQPQKAPVHQFDQPIPVTPTQQVPHRLVVEILSVLFLTTFSEPAIHTDHSQPVSMSGCMIIRQGWMVI